VDAYRLRGWDELEDLDLEAALDESVTVVEWGAGLVEGLAEDRLELVIRRAHEASSSRPDAEERTVRVTAVGDRWRGVELPLDGDHRGRGFAPVSAAP
jgi:tRNA threonylcarbamoyladenosine biosynthesis protein TsaE